MLFTIQYRQLSVTRPELDYTTVSLLQNAKAAHTYILYHIYITHTLQSCETSIIFFGV